MGKTYIFRNKNSIENVEKNEIAIKSGKPIKENKLFKTKTRLNKWDMKKITGK